jgi:hypothetical protein
MSFIFYCVEVVVIGYVALTVCAIISLILGAFLSALFDDFDQGSYLREQQHKQAEWNAQFPVTNIPYNESDWQKAKRARRDAQTANKRP